MPPGDVNGFVWAGIYTEVTSAVVESQSSSVAAQALFFCTRTGAGKKH